MRLVGTAAICVVAAFGAAFLVARSVVHQTPARAATTHAVRATVPRVTPVSADHNAELVSQFASVTAALRHKPKPKPKPRRVVHHTASTPPPSPSAPTYTTPAPTYTTPAPTYTPPAPQTTRKRSSSHSGTTTIG